MQSSDHDLDSVISGLEAELDSILASAQAADRIYEAGLREMCLELLGREKEMAAKGGKPEVGMMVDASTLALAGLDKLLTGSPTAYTRWNAAKEGGRRRKVAEVEDQEQMVVSASRDELHRSLESYLTERLGTSFLYHVPYKFRAAGVATDQRPVWAKWGTSEIKKDTPSSSQPSPKGEDESHGSAASTS
jgi:hypothetical protein